MLRFRALNQESSDESEGEEDARAPAITREAQEQHAFSQYRNALSMLSEKKVEKAKQLLESILDGDILPEADVEESAGHPLAVLKFSCLKNMGSVLEQLKDFEGALNHYVQASKLDSNDVMLWYHIGSVALKLNNLELARDAFLEALNYNPNNWQCLSNIITVLYVLEDYLSCLVFISRAFELDDTFIKGHVIRDAIIKEHPSILSSGFLEGIYIDRLDLKYDTKLCEDILQEASVLRRARQTSLLEKIPLKKQTLENPVAAMTWSALGKSLLHQHKIQQQSFVIPLKILHDADDKSICVVEQEVVAEDDKSVVAEKAAAPESVPHSGTESENQVEEVADGTSGQENDDGKSRKRRRNSLSFVAQWVWGGKRRSARVRSTVRREAEREECNLEETLHRIMPYTLFPSTEKIKDIDIIKSNDDSMDTMDLYKLFENRESAESREDKNLESKPEIETVIHEEGYFGSEAETTDVQNFLNLHNFQDLINLMDFYLRELCERWHFTWPKELILIYLEVYKLLRQHIVYPEVLCSTESLDWVQKDGWMTLLYEELALDYWLKEKLSDKKNERSGERRPIPVQEIGYLELVLTRFPSNHLLRTRILWLKAHALLNNGNIERATSCLEPESKSFGSAISLH